MAKTILYKSRPPRPEQATVSLLDPIHHGRWPLPLLVVLVAAFGGLGLGLLMELAGRTAAAHWAWIAALGPALAFLCIDIVRQLRRGNAGLDIVAAMSMGLALLLGETLAGAVVALMYSGGQVLERFAEHRARREMSALLSRVPKTATRHSNNTLEQVAIEAIAPGDRLLIRSGEAVPADGAVAANFAVLDQSVLTGESLPVHRGAGQTVLSGSINIGSPFDLVVARPAIESTYAAIVRLVENAQSVKAPIVRLADRYGIWLLVVTATIVSLTWLITDDPVRALAVLVVATPCPADPGSPSGDHVRHISRRKAWRPRQGWCCPENLGACADRGHRQDWHAD